MQPSLERCPSASRDSWRHTAGECTPERLASRARPPCHCAAAAGGWAALLTACWLCGPADCAALLPGALLDAMVAPTPLSHLSI